MANAVFTTKLEPSYDDLPECRYHFPRTYLRQAEQAVGDWIVYYEPRREAGVTSRSSGRQCYFATARVTRIEADRKRQNHFYAYIADYLEFTNPVPFREGVHYYESRLRKEDGSTNKGLFGRSIRILSSEDYFAICNVGFVDEIPALASVQQLPKPLVFAEDPLPYGRPNKTVLMERRFRDAAFTRIVRRAYGSTCAMTGLKLVNGGGRCEIEAAHIRPVEAEGPDSPRNGIALSRTVHWLFDRGFLSVDDSGEILKASGIPDPVLRLLNPNGKINIPSVVALTPHPLFLRYHRETVFKGR